MADFTNNEFRLDGKVAIVTGAGGRGHGDGRDRIGHGAGCARRRLGRPDEVAHAVAYFLDARSGFVTGQTQYVCGGLTIGAA